MMRAGVAAKDLPALTTELAPHLRSGSFVADLANGLLYTSNGPVAAVRAAALSRGGYAVQLAAATHDDRWGYTPQGLPWMQALKTRWDPGKLFNPGAFIL
jgi:hypothetical protein